jgi:hypothetical protein
VHAEIAGTPVSNLDLNGDGWCDWITPLPYPTNTQGQEYGARDAILLDTASGARTARPGSPKPFSALNTMALASKHS